MGSRSRHRASVAELALMRDGALLANAGHFSEIDAGALGPGERLTEQVTQHGSIRLLGRGEMLNLLHQNSSFSGLSSALRSPFARRCHARPSMMR